MAKKRKQKLTPQQKQAAKAAKKAEREERKALNKLAGKKARRREIKRGKKAQKALKRGTNIEAKLNQGQVANLPLQDYEEAFREVSVAGDFNLLNRMLPFGKDNWLRQTPLGKYRFVIENGQKIYLPWTDADIDRFLQGPWLKRSTTTGLAPLIHPKRKKKADYAEKARRWKKQQAKHAEKYPPSDWRHVLPIYPGQYVFKSGEESTWVKVRGPVAVAAAVVASVYFGPQVLAKIKSTVAGTGTAAGTATGASAGGAAATGAATSAATQAGFGAKVLTGAKTLTNYVNNARTVKAIVDGEIPPPPVSLDGDSFAEWTLNVAAEEAAKEMGREPTPQEMADMMAEIAMLQRDLSVVVPPGTPYQPSPAIPEIVIEKGIAVEKQKETAQTGLILAAIAGGLLLSRGMI